jgi:hypothetical protein
MADAVKKAKVMTGARAIVWVEKTAVGFFDSCDYSTSIGTEPIFILGRFGAAEIVPTSYEIITLNCSGFRIIGNGGHVLPKMPRLEDLLNLESITITVTDRQDITGAAILTVHGCVATSYGTGYSAKSTSKIRITYQGVKAHDESGEQTEAGASSLP